jgi:hypothetical protein
MCLRTYVQNNINIDRFEIQNDKIESEIYLQDDNTFWYILERLNEKQVNLDNFDNRIWHIYPAEQLFLKQLNEKLLMSFKPNYYKEDVIQKKWKPLESRKFL